MRTKISGWWGFVALYSIAVNLFAFDGPSSELVENAHAGQPQAMHELGDFMASQQNGGDFSAAAFWYEKAARAGSREAAFSFAYYRLLGLGVASDAPESYRFFLEAANAHHPAAAFWVASLLEQGLGVERSVKQAEVWYRQAARLGLRQAAPEAFRINYEARDFGECADLLKTNSELATAPGAKENLLTLLNRAQVKALQSALTEQGFDPQGIDGIWGARSQAALSAALMSAGLNENAGITLATLVQLNIRLPNASEGK